MADREFTALQDFFSDEMRSSYAKDMSYTARDGEPVSKLVDGWVKEGKVMIGRAPPKLEATGGKVSGTGTVKDAPSGPKVKAKAKAKRKG